MIWAGRPRGADPTAHFWFKHVDTDALHRICDGNVWPEVPGVDEGPVPFVPCDRCRGTYLTDVLYGRKLLTISVENPTPRKLWPYPRKLRPFPR